MRYEILIVFLSTGLLVPGLSFASTNDQAGDNITGQLAIISGGRDIIKSVDFVGNEKYTDKTLRKKLDFKVGDHLDMVLAGSGRIVITEFYQKKGFADVRATLDTAALSKGQVIYIIDEGPRFRIKSVKFEGNKQIKTGELKSAIKTKTRSWIFWSVYYTEEKIDLDLRKLRNLYFQRGFLNHDIQATGRTNILFTIDEGPQYKVGRIILTGAKRFDKERLLAGLELESGEIYYPQMAQAQAKRILKLYHENGFINAQLEQKYKFTQAPDVVDVEFSIFEGNQFRIGRVDITGNEQTQDKVIRRILDEFDFTPGQLYNAHLAPVQGQGDLEKEVQRRTMSEEVIIRPVVPAEGAEDRRDLLVSIKEGLTGMWNPGVSIGSDTGVIGQLIWSQRNFDITDWPESFGEFITMQAFKGAGQSLSIALQPGTEVSYYSVAFTEPYFRDRPTSLTVAGSSREWWRESHDEKTEKGYVGFEKRYKSGWRRSVGFRVENVEIEDLDYDAPQEIIDVKGYNLLIGTKFGLGKHKTDNTYLPSNGYEYHVSYEQVTGDYDFGILEGSSVWYRTLYEDIRDRKTILATKLLAATTLSNAPPFEKFYAGGIGYYGIRGFEYRGISTRGLQTGLPVGVIPQRKDPIGSDWIFLANTEVTVPLIGENVSGLFFIDSGTIDTGPYRAAVGAGIQIMIPQVFGPVPMRFSIATPLKKDDDDETQSFSFFLGRLF
jgi:outer membrane protein insertion porin family